ncbi:MAG: hypothetical protein NWE97_00565, partial [Candidatus Bathyarchaeota archaeon]|nr:hypothetical protein [Candidatus Bathyarchaeota archaeon]
MECRASRVSGVIVKVEVPLCLVGGSGDFRRPAEAEGFGALHLIVIYETCQDVLVGLLSKRGHINGY